MRFFLNLILTSIAVAVASAITPGIAPYGDVPAFLCFMSVGLFLGIVNSMVKPLLTVLSFPLTILTLGIFQLVINSFMLELASWLSVNLFGMGISISGFFPALMGAVIISLASGVLNIFVDVD